MGMKDEKFQYRSNGNSRRKEESTDIFQEFKKGINSWALNAIKINSHLNTLQWKCRTHTQTQMMLNKTIQKTRITLKILDKKYTFFQRFSIKFSNRTKLTELYNRHLYSHHIDSTINILPYLLYHIFIFYPSLYLSINPSLVFCFYFILGCF